MKNVFLVEIAFRLKYLICAENPVYLIGDTNVNKQNLEKNLFDCNVQLSGITLIKYMYMFVILFLLIPQIYNVYLNGINPLTCHKIQYQIAVGRRAPYQKQ